MIRYTRMVPYARRTRLGEPFVAYREEPLVPRIADRFLDCSAYLYPTAQTAKDGERIGGSGFLVAVPGFGDGWLLDGACPRQDRYHLYAATVRHSIKNPERQNFKPSTVVRLNTSDGRTALIEAMLRDWVCSDEHDVAVLPIRFHTAPDARRGRPTLPGLFPAKNACPGVCRRVS